MKKNLFVVKIYQTVFDTDEICSFYCQGNNASETEKKVENKLKRELKSDPDLNKLKLKLNLNPNLVYVQVYKVEANVKTLIKKFHKICSF